jgi:hypothetical protein
LRRTLELLQLLQMLQLPSAALQKGELLKRWQRRSVPGWLPLCAVPRPRGRS